MFQDLLRQALVEIARGHEEELCRVTEALRTENASLVGQLARLQMDLGSASQLPSADAPPKPPPLDMPNAAPPGPPPEVTNQGSPGEIIASARQNQEWIFRVHWIMAKTQRLRLLQIFQMSPSADFPMHLQMSPSADFPIALLVLSLMSIGGRQSGY
ncbi:unnamed protein product [Polarella glacialis]|uniref:Uncharacterized protein n=1 Tax=Polarella glacialis TaxID=89957 RepID=A0A813D3Q0_POLGL|nr:unnamed protein product [Polarella glacialis]